jgi:hypothetical protein
MLLLPTASDEVEHCASFELGLPSGTPEHIGVAPLLNVTVPQVTGFELPSTTVSVKVTDPP